MNYYNEIDKTAAVWLRELIRRGLIPQGEVDERSIVDVEPGELNGFTQCHFFAGIGGWSYALQLAGWPEDQPVWTGSCPCQPFSVAGKGKGESDERHLWPEFFRLIKERRPSIVFGEQVASKAGRRWLSGEGPNMQRMQDRETILRVLREFQGTPPDNLQGLREEGGTRTEAVESEHKEKLFGVARQEEGVCPDQRSQGQGKEEGVRVQLGQRGHSETHRPRILRVDGDSIQSEGREDLGFSIAGPSGQFQGVYHEERQGGRLLPECDGKYMGGEQNPGDSRRYHGAEDGQVRDLAEILNRCPEAEALNRELAGVRADLERVGYGVGAADLCAAGVNAPHIRQRLYWVADSGEQGCKGQSQRFLGASHQGNWSDFDILPCTDGKARRIEPGTFPLAHGIPARVGRLRGYGNAIVPQVAAEFITAFMET